MRRKRVTIGVLVLCATVLFVNAAWARDRGPGVNRRPTPVARTNPPARPVSQAPRTISAPRTQTSRPQVERHVTPPASQRSGRPTFTPSTGSRSTPTQRTITLPIPNLHRMPAPVPSTENRSTRSQRTITLPVPDLHKLPTLTPSVDSRTIQSRRTVTPTTPTTPRAPSSAPSIGSRESRSQRTVTPERPTRFERPGGERPVADTRRPSDRGSFTPHRPSPPDEQSHERSREIRGPDDHRTIEPPGSRERPDRPGFERSRESREPRDHDGEPPNRSGHSDKRFYEPSRELRWTPHQGKIDFRRPEDHDKVPRVIFRGDHLRFPAPPRLHGGHVIVPVAPFLEKIGGQLCHDPHRDEWHARCGGRDLRFRLGDHRAYIGDRVIFLVRAPFLSAGFIYCPLGPFASVFRVPYRWNEYTCTAEIYPSYVPEPDYLFISEDLAIATASEYLTLIGAYPESLIEVDAHRQMAPANYYWETVITGSPPVEDAPLCLCWVVEFHYRGLTPDARRQVFVDAETGEVVGGWEFE